MSHQQLTLSDRTMLGYTGVDARAVADAERITVTAVRETRTRLGRRPSDGEPISQRLVQAEDHARHARGLQRVKMDADAQAHWGEANFQATLALHDRLDDLERLMRSNRNPSL